MYLITTVLFLSVLIVIPNSHGQHNFKNCEKQLLTKCNKVFMETYKCVKKDNDYMKVYCQGYQNFGNCLSSSVKTCNGTYIDIFRLLIAEHMLLDKRTDVCPGHEFESLKAVVKANVEHQMHIHTFSKLEAAEVEECAKQINQKCANVMANALLSSNKMCRDVKKFLGCYRNPGIPCDAELYRGYLDASNTYGRVLLKMEESNPGMMPNC